jgi:NADH-quinone oxidoreductase subunit F
MPDDALDLSLVQVILEKFIPKGRHALIPALHEVQAAYGYLPAPVAKEVAAALKVPLSEVFGVIEFYSMFYSQPVKRTIVHVCNDPACAMAGSEALMKNLVHQYVGASAEASGEGVTVERAPCLGLCELAPAIMVRDVQRGHVDASGAGRLLEEFGEKPYSILGGSVHELTANCGKRRPTTLEEYTSAGGYAALRKALTMEPAAVIAEVKASGLVGRGGAAFPTGLKWESAAKEPTEPKYVICNADEAEPGTFKDRVLLEEDPHRILEGLIIASYAVGSHQATIFLRGEYTNALLAMTQAIEEAQAAGILGKSVFGSGFELEVELFRGAGAYVCGEETALFEALEGKRGFPRMKPPFPTTSGLYGKPTVINNVETLSNIPSILIKGAADYRKVGTEKSPGTKLFCLSGDIRRPGLYEVPFGISIRHLIYDLAGGIREGRDLKGILFGGAAGAFADATALEVTLSFEDLKAHGLPLGSGVITVFDESRDLRDALARLAYFFADQSCGKCYPCQLGTRRQLEVIERVAAGRMLPGDRDRLTDVGWTMTDASLCGLGQTAASAVMSALKLWPELFVEIPPAGGAA